MTSNNTNNYIRARVEGYAIQQALSRVLECPVLAGELLTMAGLWPEDDEDGTSRI